MTKVMSDIQLPGILALVCAVGRCNRVLVSNVMHNAYILGGPGFDNAANARVTDCRYMRAKESRVIDATTPGHSSCVDAASGQQPEGQ